MPRRSSPSGGHQLLLGVAELAQDLGPHLGATAGGRRGLLVVVVGQGGAGQREERQGHHPDVCSLHVSLLGHTGPGMDY
jgi:hypothetical protein